MAISEKVQEKGGAVRAIAKVVIGVGVVGAAGTLFKTARWCLRDLVMARSLSRTN